MLIGNLYFGTIYATALYCLPRLCDEGIKHLADTTPKLKMLILLSSAELTDACMESIGRLTELIELQLGRCSQLTDKGMVHLQSLTKLEYLGLSSNRRCTNELLQYVRSPFLININCTVSSINQAAANVRVKQLRAW